MPEWAKEITLKEPQQRTQQEIHSIVQLMKQLKGFRRYSFKVQESICGALKYDCFGRSRVVIRKGHHAQQFYFVFSGSVCVTVDDDEHSALVKPSTLLRRGDHFGELAFIRGLKRAATVVCLERTELLSVERDDFFSAKIDVSFNEDMQRRVELLKEHHVFSTWPSDVVKQVAEESILQDYNSDEVIIRDSSKMQRIVFVTKGQCNVLRLLDLSNCKEYIDHALKYRVEKIKEDGSTIYNPDVEDISLSSVVLRGFPPRVKSPEENSSAASSENKIRKKVKSAPPYTNSGLHQPIMTVSQPVKGILHSESARGKSLRGRVSFQDEHRELPGVEKELLQPSESPPRSPKPSGMLHQMNGPEEGFREKHAEGENVGVGVYMMVDRLRPGQCFGAWSLLELEDQFLPTAEKASPPSQQNERDLHSHKKKSFKRQTKENKPRDRRFTLVSAGCEVVKVAKEVFFKYSDAETLDKLKRLTTNYPKDSFLCQTYLQQSDWRTYRENVVDNVVVRHIARLETAKGSARSHKVRSSQVPSPLGSVKMWPSVNSRWEYFPEEGWVSVQVTKPIVAAGTSRPHSSDYSAVNSRSRCQSPSSRKQSAHATPRGSPVPLPSPTSKSSEKLLPLVKNDLVLAQGSQRTLVLTHGGSRSNNYQLKIERRIIDKHESRKNNPLVNKVK